MRGALIQRAAIDEPEGACENMHQTGPERSQQFRLSLALEEPAPEPPEPPLPAPTSKDSRSAPIPADSLFASRREANRRTTLLLPPPPLQPNFDVCLAA